MTTWYAVLNTTGEVIAEADSMKACSDDARAAGYWSDFGDPAGSVAPYSLQTYRPAERQPCD